MHWVSVEKTIQSKDINQRLIHVSFDLHSAIIGLIYQFSVFLRVAVLHRCYCSSDDYGESVQVANQNVEYSILMKLHYAVLS